MRISPMPRCVSAPVRFIDLDSRMWQPLVPDARLADDYRDPFHRKRRRCGSSKSCGPPERWYDAGCDCRTQWTLSNTALATMSSNALTAKAPGSLTVQAAYVEATPAGNSPASATVTPETLTASTQVTSRSRFQQRSGDHLEHAGGHSYGTALSSTQLSATANVPGTFVYTPAAGTVLKAGKQTLSAVFTPTNTQTYSAATASVQLTVNQATPSITWATPAPIR